MPGGVKNIFVAKEKLSWEVEFWISRIHLYGLLSIMCKINLLLAVLIQEWFAEKFLLPMHSVSQTRDKEFQG